MKKKYNFPYFSLPGRWGVLITFPWFNISSLRASINQAANPSVCVSVCVRARTCVRVCAVVPGVAAGSFAAPSQGTSPSCHYVY